MEPTDRRECKDCLMELRLSSLSSLRFFDFDAHNAIAAVSNASATPTAPKTPTATISFLHDRGSMLTLGSIKTRIIFCYSFLSIFFYLINLMEFLRTDLADKQIGLRAIIDFDGLIREHRALIHSFQLLHPHTLRIIESFLLLACEFPEF